MIHTVMLLAILASLFLMIVPIASLTREVLAGHNRWTPSPRAWREARSRTEEFAGADRTPAGARAMRHRGTVLRRPPLP
jgi:hypothetical protein